MFPVNFLVCLNCSWNQKLKDRCSSSDWWCRHFCVICSDKNRIGQNSDWIWINRHPAKCSNQTRPGIRRPAATCLRHDRQKCKSLCQRFFANRSDSECNWISLEFCSLPKTISRMEKSRRKFMHYLLSEIFIMRIEISFQHWNSVSSFLKWVAYRVWGSRRISVW